MAKYHLNPAKGPLRCTAADGQCPYGSDAPHFATKVDAQEAFEQKLELETNPLNSIRKPKTLNRPKVLKSKGAFTPELHNLDEKLESLEFDEIQEFANDSPATHRKLNSLINARAANSPKRYQALHDLDPKNPDAKNPISYSNFKLLNKDWGNYRNQTAVLVDAYLQSPHYNSLVENYPDDAKVGNAIPVTSLEHDDPEWHLSRYNSIGGSDVGALVIKEYVPLELQSSFDKLYIKKVETSKMVKPTEETALKSIYMSEQSRRGALYRGTVWEDRIRDDYAKDHPELKVYKTKSQYRSAKNSWHKVNLDGLVSNRPDGKPNGILEIKTGGVPEKWEDGVPPEYRAQTLYYLEATELDYADVRILLNDGESRDFRLYRNDEVYPGSGITMKDYIPKRVLPWFDELKKKREAA